MMTTGVKDLSILNNLTDKQLLEISDIVSTTILFFNDDADKTAFVRNILIKLFGNDSTVHLPELAKLILPITVERMFEYKKSSNSKDIATKEQRETFNEIMSEITEKKTSVKYPDSVFYMKGDSVYMEHELKTDIFYIKYYNFWEVFEKSNLKYKEIKELLRVLLEEHLNCIVIRTQCSSLARGFKAERLSQL